MTAGFSIPRENIKASDVVRLLENAARTPRKKPSKYRNKITYVGTRKFHSQKEARRFVDLERMEQTGEIAQLECQVRLKMIALSHTAEAVKIGTYIVDFRYFDNRTGKLFTRT